MRKILPAFFILLLTTVMTSATAEEIPANIREAYPVQSSTQMRCARFLMEFNDRVDEITNSVFQAGDYTEQTELLILETYAHRVLSGIRLLFELFAIEKIHAKEGQYSNAAIRMMRIKADNEINHLVVQKEMIQSVSASSGKASEEKKYLIEYVEQAKTLMEDINKDLSRHTWQ